MLFGGALVLTLQAIRARKRVYGAGIHRYGRLPLTILASPRRTLSTPRRERPASLEETVMLTLLWFLIALGAVAIVQGCDRGPRIGGVS